MIEIIPNWHPLFVHFTVALITISGVFFILARLIGDRKFADELLVAARYSLWAGGFFTVITVIAGFFAYYSVAHDIPSHLAMMAHRNWALVTLFAILASVVWSLIHYRNKIKPTKIFILAMLIVLALVATTGWRGGELVYRYGLGVMSLPENSEAGHQHDHGEILKKNNQTPKAEISKVPKAEISKVIEEHGNHKH